MGMQSAARGAIGSICVIGFCACGPNLAFLANRSQSEAQTLQKYCSRANVQGQEIAQANTLLSQSLALSQDGKAEKSRTASEQAVGLYRVALARADKEKTEADAAAADSALGQDKTRLAAYREILDEMKSMGKP